MLGKLFDRASRLCTNARNRSDQVRRRFIVRQDSGVATGKRTKQAICMARSPRKLPAR